MYNKLLFTRFHSVEDIIKKNLRRFRNLNVENINATFIFYVHKNALRKPIRGHWGLRSFNPLKTAVGCYFIVRKQIHLKKIMNLGK